MLDAAGAHWTRMLHSGECQSRNVLIIEDASARVVRKVTKSFATSPVNVGNLLACCRLPGASAPPPAAAATARLPHLSCSHTMATQQPWNHLCRPPAYTNQTCQKPRSHHTSNTWQPLAVEVIPPSCTITILHLMQLQLHWEHHPVPAAAAARVTARISRAAASSSNASSSCSPVFTNPAPSTPAPESPGRP